MKLKVGSLKTSTKLTNLQLWWPVYKRRNSNHYQGCSTKGKHSIKKIIKWMKNKLKHYKHIMITLITLDFKNNSMIIDGYESFWSKWKKKL
jgi:hypothetical protein